ncbi:MAG: hypothetical protein J3K34DRAFT_520293 [Monoraphidium minutum]|nr:MAG: hypothetical protein J3K34DRAFT_520293 [Monoraphidium minutum]
MSGEPADKPAEEVKPTPVFGAGLAGTGFGGFTGVTSSSAVAPAPAAAGAEGGEGGEGEEADPEAECQAEFKPLVQLDEVETSTGEEDEESLVDLKCKLYRFDSNNNEWKERGIGQRPVRLLKHKANQRIRLLMRQEKTLKIRANHIVMPGTKLQEHAGSDKAWVWSTVDFSEGEQKVELFCIRFGTAEKAQDFKAKYEEAEEANAAVLAGAPLATATKGDAAADSEADKLADEIEAKAAVKEEAEEAAEAKEPVAA